MPEPGEMRDVVLAEFPDDIDESIKFKKDYWLVREDEESGTYSIRLHSPHSQEPVAVLLFDESGNCISQEIGSLESRRVEENSLDSGSSE